MYGAGNEFLSGARFPENEDGSFTGCDGSDLIEYLLERRTIPHDFSEVAFGSDFAFKVPTPFAEPLFQCFDLRDSPLVFDRQGKLRGELVYQFLIVGVEGILSCASQNEHTQWAVGAHQGSTA